jgi:uncharacterized protein YjbI with pentapeptide repeats
VTPEGESLSLPVHLALPARTKDKVPLVHDASLEAATLTWQFAPGQMSLVLVAKATFELVHGGAAEPLDESTPLAGDEPHAEGGSLRTSSDFVPWKPRVDVTMSGFAYGSPQEPVQRVALSLGDAHLALAAIGDRTWQGTQASAPRPFERIPLTWEYAFGGKGFAANPVGRGFGQRVLPNLEDPNALIRSPNDEPRPMGFGPIASDWTPRRTALGGTYDRAWLEQAWPYLPADFDWSYFNAAPASLQASALEGDEPYELLGVHPEKAHSAIRGRLPGVSVRALALGKTESGTRLTEVPLRIDTVRFDAEALTVSLTWRGALAVSGPTAPELDRVFFFTERLGAQRPLTEMFGEVTRTVLERYGADAIPVTKQEREAAREPKAPSHGERPTTDGASAGAFVAGCTTLEGANLSGFDLRELDLSGKNLRGARLIGAWLHGAKLDGADLRGAMLVRARGLNTSLRGANLEGANLSEAVLPTCDFTGANLTYASGPDAHFEGCSFEEATLSRANLSEATLRNTRFQGARLEGTVLSGAWLEGASFQDAKLDNAELHDVNAKGISFAGASAKGLRADGARLDGADLTRVDASNASFDGAELSRAEFVDAKLDGAVFAHAILEGARLDRIQATGARFRHAVLIGAFLRSANLKEARFDHADLTRVNFTGANLYGVDTEGARIEQVQLKGALVACSRFAGSAT